MISQLVLPGDSLTQGTEGNCVTAKGGKGSWPEVIAERLANISGVGPLLSPGLRGCWLGIVAGDKSGEWTKTGTWTQTVSTDAFDKAPHGFAYRASGGTGDVMTWTKPSQWRPIVGASVEWINYSAGGSWQYRIDGGTWTNHGQGAITANSYRRFYINTPITSTIEFRAYDGSANAGICLVGIIPYFVNPTGVTQGLIVQDLGVNGQTLHSDVLVTSGDRLAFYDSVVVAAGAISNAPNVGVVMLGPINDVLVLPSDASTWAADLTTFYNRVHPLGPLGLICPYGMKTSTYNNTDQTLYRAQTATSAAGFGTPAKVMSLFDQWAANGWATTNTLQSSTGLADGRLLADAIHPAQPGHLDLAERIYWFVRNQILGLGNVPSTYAATAKQSAVQYGAKAAAVQYAAGVPIGVG